MSLIKTLISSFLRHITDAVCGLYNTYFQLPIQSIYHWVMIFAATCHDHNNSWFACFTSVKWYDLDDLLTMIYVMGTNTIVS